MAVRHRRFRQFIYLFSIIITSRFCHSEKPGIRIRLCSPTLALNPSALNPLLIHCCVQHVRLLRRPCFSATMHVKASTNRRFYINACFLDILLYDILRSWSTDDLKTSLVLTAILSRRPVQTWPLLLVLLVTVQTTLTLTFRCHANVTTVSARALFITRIGHRPFHGNG